jgi:glycine dehydrogenase subunit 2
MSELIFEISRPGRVAYSQQIACSGEHELPASLLRTTPTMLPEVSELDVVRHYTVLSQKNFSIDTHPYYLGSCTMKYNPRAAHRAAMLAGFANAHPMAPSSVLQGTLACLYDLQEILKTLTGMSGVSLSPMAGAQGEFAGVAMIKAYHAAQGQSQRHIMLVPDTAHGTNPASAVMCGYDVVEVKTKSDGDVDLQDLEKHLSDQVAGIMLTNPSTGGVFERQIKVIAQKIHACGGLLYYDGANLNAIAGMARPGDMGFDVLHLNLHKTFATPHGGGGPGSGPVACAKRLEPYLPVPFVVRDESGAYAWQTQAGLKTSIGRLSAFAGNAGILLRAYIYARMLGREGFIKAAQLATLNANYLLKRLVMLGIEPAYPTRRATHECLVTFKRQAKEHGVTARDIAKRLLDYKYHAPTTYFPLVVPECFLIEPTETESKESIDGFVAVLATIMDEIKSNPEMVKSAPQTMPVRRLDDVKAARELNITYKYTGAS